MDFYRRLFPFDVQLSRDDHLVTPHTGTPTDGIVCSSIPPQTDSDPFVLTADYSFIGVFNCSVDSSPDVWFQTSVGAHPLRVTSATEVRLLVVASDATQTEVNGMCHLPSSSVKGYVSANIAQYCNFVVSLSMLRKYGHCN